MRDRFYILWLVGVLFPFLIFAQAGIKNEHISEQNGLSHRWVYKIIQDQNGFIWIATENGLNRYDGYEFKHYSLGDDLSPIQRINAVQESIDGMLWISKNEKIIIFDPSDHSFRQAERGIDYFEPHQTEKALIQSQFWSFLRKFDALKGDNNIGISDFTKLEKQTPRIRYKSMMIKSSKEDTWVWHIMEFGFFNKDEVFHYRHFDHNSQKWKNYDISKFLDIPLVHDFLPIDANRRFWYPVMDPEAQQPFDSFQLPEDIPVSSWKTIQVDNHINIWLFNRDQRLFRYHIKRKEFEYFGKFGQPRSTFLLDIFEDREQTIWIGSQNGLTKITKSKQLFQNYLNEPFDLGERQPIGQSIYDIVQGKNVWPFLCWNWGFCGILRNF